MAHKIKASWLNWRIASGLLCDRRISTKLKEKFYRMTIRPVMLYGTDYLAVKKITIQKLSIEEMRMLR